MKLAVLSKTLIEDELKIIKNVFHNLSFVLNKSQIELDLILV